VTGCATAVMTPTSGGGGACGGALPLQAASASTATNIRPRTGTPPRRMIRSENAFTENLPGELRRRHRGTPKKSRY
jgi:hypothetical protein